MIGRNTYFSPSSQKTAMMCPEISEQEILYYSVSV